MSRLPRRLAIRNSRLDATSTSLLFRHDQGRPRETMFVDGWRIETSPAGRATAQTAAAGPFRELAQLAPVTRSGPYAVVYELTLIVRSLLLPTFLAMMVPFAC